MLAGGDYPDLIFAKEDANKLIEAGVLIDLAPYIEQYGPNIKKLYGGAVSVSAAQRRRPRHLPSV